MTNFTYDNTVPAASHNPSVDQPVMLINSQSSASIWDEDHIGFGSDNGGTHVQQTYTGFSVGTLITGAANSTAYPAAGVAVTANPQYYFKNTNGIRPLSPIAAFAGFTSTTSPTVPTLDNAYNVTATSTTTSLSTTIYTLTLATGIVSGNAPIIIPFFNSATSVAGIRIAQGITYTFTNPTLTLTIATSAIGAKIGFIVLQI